jgi:hypothetical protein
MDTIRSTADLTEGAVYELPTGERVVAGRETAGAGWFLRGLVTGRRYAIVPDASLRLISADDAQGHAQRIETAGGALGSVTGFTVADVRPVADD